MTDEPNKYLQRFLDGLGKDKNLNNWKYAGGESDAPLEYYLLNYGELVQPGHKDSCICGHPILDNRYIVNIKSGKFKVVGSHCIKKFLPEENRGKTCKSCHSPIKRRTTAYCTYCSGGTMKIGKYRGRTYLDLKEGDLNYALWAISKNIDKDFTEWWFENE